MEKRFPGYNMFIALAAIFLYSWFSSATSAMTMDYFIGHVISVDRQSNRFVLRIDQNADEPFDRASHAVSGQIDLATGNKDMPEEIPVHLVEEGDRSFLPGCVRPGELVRVWGKYSHGEESVFQAVDVRGTRGWVKDRSGVRSRLGRGHRFGNCDHSDANNGSHK